MAALTQHLINLLRGIGRIPGAFRAPARRCLCAGALLTLAPFCQAQVSDLQLPEPTHKSPWSSEDSTKSAFNSITASGPANGPLVINGTSEVTFVAGSQINLEPGFQATAGGAGTTFHAFIGPVLPQLTDAVTRTGVKSTGSYWGGGGEQIDLLSGNLNYSIPLIQAKGRGSLGATFTLSYNSQIWRQSGGTPWLDGRDTGFGLGWTLQAGSLLPVLGSYYVFTDSTGAEYKLDQNNGSGVWTSSNGTYVAYDSGAQRLYFPNGTFWVMNVISGSAEADAGTLYPSLMQDTNGNSIQIQYGPAAGTKTANTSGRITQIADARSGNTAYCLFTYTYLNGADLYPHLTGITNNISTGENYSFGYGSDQSLTSPFSGTVYGTATVLQAVTLSSFNISYNLQYGLHTGELTQASTPTGGSQSWGYGTYTYSGTGLSYREVQSRQMSPSPGVTYSWTIARDNNPTMHASATVTDLGAGSSKAWTFGTSGVSQGLATSYEERGSGGGPLGALLHKDYTWTTDNKNVYVGAVVSTLYDASGSQVQTKTTQTLDIYGNLIQSAVYDYGNLNAKTPAMTYTYTYVTDGNYTSRYIRNRLLQAMATPARGNTAGLAGNAYDAYSTTVCGGQMGLVARTGLPLHDDTNYGTGFVYRGNPTSTWSVGSSASMLYETTGVVTCGVDGAGNYVTSAPAAGTAYSLPGVLTPNGNSSLATTVTYGANWAVTSLTGPNGAQGTTTYDLYGRPQSTKIPDGAETDYGYAYAGVNGAAANQQTAILGTGTAARWKRTTQDGFGRVVRVENGNGDPTKNAAVSQVDTQYGPCACSPLGKVSQVSTPYAPNGRPVWTTYTYDGSGRTLTVTAPDGSQTHTEYLTTYAGLAGNYVRVTDPAGKWKVQQIDAVGNLINVFEQNPAGGADWVTTYTYDAVGHVISVSMPRSNGIQTRTFAYSGADLISATNPENGMVTYQYDGAHHVTLRTDALGQQTRYTYDAYGRLTEVQHWAGSPLVEQTQQRVDYYYDSNPLNGSYSQYAWGRLTAMTFTDERTGGPFSYMYSYNQAGRVTAQHMDYDRGTGNAVNFDAAYTWDQEGRMTSINYGPQYTLTYDANGRLGGMSGNDLSLSATYAVGGQLTGLSYQGSYPSDFYGETRWYNNMQQMTWLNVAGTSFSQSFTFQTALNMNYVYTAGANNGRIAQSVDNVTNETVNYTYDTLNRLTAVSAAGDPGGAWSQKYTYDGFGNMTGKSAVGTYQALNLTYNPATNSAGGNDANGNPTAPGYTFDVENRMITGAGNGYVYDPAGKRVKKAYGNAWEFYFYGVGGQKLVTLACVMGDNGLGCPTGNQYNVYFGGKLVKSKGMVVAADRLGSVRANSNGERMSYYPYGEERTSTADDREKFGTYMRDGPYQDYADQRYYAPWGGRFLTPDPGGILTADPKTPGSWNRYGYVQGDPVKFIDRHGRNADDCEEGCDDAMMMATMVEVEEEANPEGGGRGGGGSATPSLADLLKASISRVTFDLGKPACAKDYSSASDTASELSNVSLHDNGETRYRTDKKGKLHTKGEWGIITLSQGI